MIETRLPKYQWGQYVIAVEDMFNDGSYPDLEADALIVAKGIKGEIVNIGHHADQNIPIYLVEFPGKVVGCLEEEIALAIGAA